MTGIDSRPDSRLAASLRVPLAACLLALAGAAAAAPPWAAELAAAGIDRAAFTEVVRAAFVERHPEVEVRVVGPLELDVAMPGVDPGRVFLDNLHRSLEAQPRARVLQVERFVEVSLSASALPDLGPRDAARVRPVIRHELFVLESDLADGGRPGLLAEPYVGDLFLLYVIDLGDRMAYLNRTQLERLGIDRARLRDLAIGNLEERADAVRVLGDGPAWMLVLDGTYESSLLLLDAVWNLIGERIGDDVVAAVPARDAVFFTAAGDAAAVEQVRRAAARVSAESGYSITDRLLLRRAGTWTPLP